MNPQKAALGLRLGDGDKTTHIGNWDILFEINSESVLLVPIKFVRYWYPFEEMLISGIGEKGGGCSNKVFFHH